MISCDYIVVGAGPAGLTLADSLARSGKVVVVIERDDREGGLAKSFTLGTNWFDIGPKRFHTEDPVVLSHILGVLGDDVLEIPRSSKVHFLDRFFDWPLNHRALSKLPPGTSLRCLIDLLNRPPIRDRKSFREYIENKYGKTLYRIFFQPYTEKFLHLGAEEVSADWASTGINRAIVDEKERGNSLIEILQSLTLPPTRSTRFIYPTRRGFGFFCERLRERCENTGGVECYFSQEIVKLEHPGSRSEIVLHVADGRRFDAERVVWTGNVNDLTSLIAPNRSNRLRYLNTLLYVIAVESTAVNHRNTAQWIYLSSEQNLISRVSCPKEFADYCCPNQEYTFVCEVTDSQSHPQHMPDPEKRLESVIQELAAVGLISHPQAVTQTAVVPIRDSYPVYHRDYLADFGRATKSVQQFSRRISLLGRAGAFWYNNSDHSMRQALEMANYFLNKGGRSFNYRKYFGGVSTR